MRGFGGKCCERFCSRKVWERTGSFSERLEANQQAKTSG